jgi:TolA-binding protein
VEAARDGRLTGTARASFDAHLSTCAICTKEAEVLEGLAQGLRSLRPEEVDDVALRRLRNDLLEAVDAEQTGRGKRGARRARSMARVVAFAMAAILVGLVGFFSWRAMTSGRAEHDGRDSKEARETQHVTEPVASMQMAPAQQAQQAQAEQTSIDVTTVEGTRYTRAIVADAEVFELAAGKLRLQVRRPTGGRRVLVKVPDGEIEDLGTVFDVLVSDGHTQRVVVDEGRVIVRVKAAPAVTVEAGKTWTREMGPATSASANTNTNTNANTNATANAKASASASAKANADGNAEDAAYLDVIRLLRQGREEEARAAAASYLRAFPKGFRRAEMERVARAK